MKKATRNFYCRAHCVTHALVYSRTNIAAGVLWKELAELNGRVRDGS